MLPPTAAPAAHRHARQPAHLLAAPPTTTRRLNSVEISLRNNTTRENLASDGTWGTDVVQDWYRISPLNLSGASYNWSYTTPFNLKPGSYTLPGPGDRQPRPDHVVGQPGPAHDQRPGARATHRRTRLITSTGTITGGQSLHLDLAGTATDDKGVKAVNVSLYDNDTSKYLQPNGTLGSGVRDALGHAGARPDAMSTTWTLPVNLPQAGD